MEPRICLSDSVSTPPPSSLWMKRWDKLALHPLMAVPLFLLVMYGLFIFAMGVGGIFQDFFEQMARASVVYLARMWPAILPAWLNHLVEGLSRGVALTASFIPVLMGLFLGLGTLEQSGYMARVAHTAQGLTRWIGLPGKAFIPLLVGFGCNVPAVMGTRILHNPRDRILTIMMLPFMSCGARLAIYAVFVSAFFAESGYRYIFILYLIGILVAIFTVLIFKHAWFRGIPSGLSVSTKSPDTVLPPYRWPDWRGIFKQSIYRVKKFIRKAGLVIIPCCLALGSIGELKTLTGVDIEWMGRQLTPIFKPLGIEKDNWPATIGLLTGMFAKEVLVGSLGALYRASGDNAVLTVDSISTAISFTETAKQAVASIGQNAQKFGEKLFHPFNLETKTERMQPETQRLMVSCFGSNVAAFSYLLFVLLYFPCISVVVVIAKELNGYWAALSILWSTGLAYVISVIFYQSFRLQGAAATEAFEIMGMALALFACMMVGLYGLGWFWGNRSDVRTSGKSIAITLIN